MFCPIISYNSMIDRFLSMFTDFYRVLPRFTKFHRVLPSFTEFGFFLSYWRRLWPMFCPIISYNSVIDRFLSMFTDFYRVLPSFTEFYRVLPSFTEFGFFLSYWRRLWPMFCPIISYNSVIDRFLSMFTGFLPSFTGFYRVLPSFTEFHRVLSSLFSSCSLGRGSGQCFAR